jgi:hypothetical protein
VLYGYLADVAPHNYLIRLRLMEETQRGLGCSTGKNLETKPYGAAASSLA